MTKKISINIEDPDFKKKLIKMELEANGEETKILINKANLEEILENLPENCPFCKNEFKKDNFYLVDIADGCGSETYVECLCGDYRTVVKKDDG